MEKLQSNLSRDDTPCGQRHGEEERMKAIHKATNIASSNSSNKNRGGPHPRGLVQQTRNKDGTRFCYEISLEPQTLLWLVLEPAQQSSYAREKETVRQK
jgi:hypothetical protein